MIIYYYYYYYFTSFLLFHLQDIPDENWDVTQWSAVVAEASLSVSFHYFCSIFPILVSV